MAHGVLGRLSERVGYVQNPEETSVEFIINRLDVVQRDVLAE